MTHAVGMGTDDNKEGPQTHATTLGRSREHYFSFMLTTRPRPHLIPLTHPPIPSLRLEPAAGHREPFNRNLFGNIFRFFGFFPAETIKLALFLVGWMARSTNVRVGMIRVHVEAR